MTSVEMLQMVRAYLEETSEKFYLDDEEIFPALAEAQEEIIHAVMKNWEKDRTQPFPSVLQDLVVGATTVIGTADPAEITGTEHMGIVRISWNPAEAGVGSYPNRRECDIVSAGEVDKYKYNPEMANSYIAWQSKTRKVYVLPIGTNAGASAIYETVNRVSAIAVGQNPSIGEEGHEACVFRALWILLKDRELQHAQLHLQRYNQILVRLMQ